MKASISGVGARAVGTKASSLGGKSGDTAFLNVLERAGGAKQQPGVVEQVWQKFHHDWQNAGVGSERLIKRLPSQAREMIELQVTVNRLHLRSMMATKAAEAVSNTVKRMQQMGSS